MKISRVRHVIITSIIFLVIIAVMVGVFTSIIDAMREDTQDKVYRVVATEDIEQGKLITDTNVKLIEMNNVLEAENMIYRKGQNDNIRNTVDETKRVQGFIEQILTKKTTKENVEEQERIDLDPPTDNLWAVGKVAKEKIYKGEVLIAEKVVKADNMVGEETRLYAVPFDSSTTGGYNIELGEKVDICVLYSDNDKTISEYQSLPANKVIDIVLAGKHIADIRDESGNSVKIVNGVVPGYLCFNLTYEEINKLEVAKRQGTLFIGSAESYYKDGGQVETFMTGATMPNF